MTAVLFVFLTACLTALAFTPLVRRFALHFDLIDKPSARKIHSKKVPRVGGIALFSSFFLPFVLLLLFRRYDRLCSAPPSFFADTSTFCFVTGAVLIFLLGLRDDIRELSFLVKISGQVLVAVFVYFCGLQITAVTTPFGPDFSIGLLSLPLTVFWFLLVINAINLIDGLDGLAAGICLFVSLSMLFICLVNGQYNTPALAFAALAGALIGFLRYNFHPASIFMGDSGSYFLGYCLAALSIEGTIKGQVATALLIPVIALGVPLTDTLWAPVRRFLNGQSMFQADKQHIHHRLVTLGFTHQRAVLMLYILTVVLRICSMLLVHTQNTTSALILFVLGIGLIGLLKYLSGSDLVNIHTLVSWARDLSDETGFSLQRRLFFHHQRKIASAPDPEALWEAVCVSLEMLGFDSAEFYFIEKQQEVITAERSRHKFCWTAGNRVEPIHQESLLRIELPIHRTFTDTAAVGSFGTLLLMKDMRSTATEPYLLRRVEQLRRSMIAALERMTAGSG